MNSCNNSRPEEGSVNAVMAVVSRDGEVLSIRSVQVAVMCWKSRGDHSDLRRLPGGNPSRISLLLVQDVKGSGG